MVTTDGSFPLPNTSERGERLASQAEQFVGACGCKAHRDSMTLALGLGSGAYFDWRPFHVTKDGAVIGVSTCGMFVGACLSRANVTDKFLPWHVGQPLGSFTAWAFHEGLWTKYRAGLEPQRGDVLLIGKDGGTHICIVSSLHDGILESVDGGQCCTALGNGHEGIGRQAVKKVVRTWDGKGFVRGPFGLVPVVGWASMADNN